VRVNRRSAARLAAVAVACLAALQVFPALLRPPEPPPLPPDVGLPIHRDARPPAHAMEPNPIVRSVPERRPKPRFESQPRDGKGTAGSRAAAAAPTALVPVPPAPASPPPPPVPAPAAAAPVGDGSEEFAPR
jgi:hypothetical protein